MLFDGLARAQCTTELAKAPDTIGYIELVELRDYLDWRRKR